MAANVTARKPSASACRVSQTYPLVRVVSYSLQRRQGEGVLDKPVRITQERAQALLNECKWLLIVFVGAELIGGGIVVYLGDVNATAIALIVIGWFAGIGYLIWLGRLADGLGRSIIYYVGGTLLAGSFIAFVAHIIAYYNIRAAVRKAFPSSQVSPVSPT